MKKLCLLLLGSLLLLAQPTYPELFSSLGTPLYKADLSFSKLPKDQHYSSAVQNYHHNQAKALALSSSKNKKAYFKALRDLEKEHNQIISILKREITTSIKDKDYTNFITINNVGIDTLYQQESFKEQVYSFYLKHKKKKGSAYLEKRIQSEKGYQKLYGIDISSSPVQGESYYKRQKQVILLSRSGCGWCTKLKKFMKSKNIHYKEYNIHKSTKGSQLFKKYHGTGLPMTIIGQQVIRGYAPDSIMSAL